MIDPEGHPIIVLGVERSGTSVVAEMLHRWVLMRALLNQGGMNVTSAVHRAQAEKNPDGQASP